VNAGSLHSELEDWFLPSRCCKANRLAVGLSAGEQQAATRDGGLARHSSASWNPEEVLSTLARRLDSSVRWNDRSARHSCESRNPEEVLTTPSRIWIPASAGMTKANVIPAKAGIQRKY